MILITGASGHLGKAVVENLLKHVPANQVVAFVRDPNKVSDLQAKGVIIRVGHYDDAASLERAMKGVEKVLLISGLDAHRLEQHKRVIDAAKNAGVKHMAYTGVTFKDINTSSIKAFMEGHFKTDAYLQESGVNYTLLRNSLYAEAIPGFVGDKVFETGIYLPAGNGKVAFALRSDMAEAAANVLVQPGHENKIYQLTGSEALSFDEIAKTLSALSGKTVAYVSPEAEVFKQQLKEWGVPEIGILIAGGFSADISKHQYDVVTNDLEKLLGRKPVRLEAALKSIYNL